MNSDKSEEEELRAEVERLRRENKALAEKNQRALSLKVSVKGAVSLYGLGRFPVTLYKGQWLKVLDAADDIREFIKEHEAELKSKPGKSAEE